jgi:hypothetical protein
MRRRGPSVFMSGGKLSLADDLVIETHEQFLSVPIAKSVTKVA